jgi:hypothetical protein
VGSGSSREAELSREALSPNPQIRSFRGFRFSRLLLPCGYREGDRHPHRGMESKRRSVGSLVREVPRRSSTTLASTLDLTSSGSEQDFAGNSQWRGSWEGEGFLTTSPSRLTTQPNLRPSKSRRFTAPSRTRHGSGIPVRGGTESGTVSDPRGVGLLVSD